MDDAELHDKPWWLLAIVGSTVSWALADLILDVTIGEESATGPSQQQQQQTGSAEDGSDDAADEGDERGEDGPHVELTSLTKRNRDAPGSTAAAPTTVRTPSPRLRRLAKKKDTHMTGDQDTAVAGLVTLVIVYVMCFLRWTSHRKLAREFEAKRAAGMDVAGLSSGVGGVWSPFHDFEWWVAALGGVLLFWHYQTLYWAYDTAPSTVINPLLQVSSTWVLLGTGIPAMLTGADFIQPFDLFCYAVIVVGGLLPSLEGDFKAMLRGSFWRQPFVKNAVLSEFSLGLYDLLLAWVVKQGKLEMSHERAVGEFGPYVLENEFFFIAWCWFVVSFSFAYGLHPRLQEEYIGLQRVSPRMLVLAGVGQVLMVIGYYSSSFGYSWFYNVSVVHAAEASMAQGFNLIAAFTAKTCFNVGRDSAVQGMRYKVVSVVIVSVGLFLVAFHDLGKASTGSGGAHGR